MEQERNPSVAQAGGPVTLSFGCRSDVGRRREHNEDSFAVFNRAKLGGRLDALLVVADGMGGVGGGDVASRLAVQTLSDAVLEELAKHSGRSAADLLQDAVMQANQAVRANRSGSPQLRQMGATCVAAVVDVGDLILANVGDSRAYLLRGVKLTQLTEDHSPVWEEVRSGRMTREEARHNPFRNRISRGIGLEPEIEVDLYTLPLEPGDTLLLCSDGLSSEVDETRIARILAGSAEAQEASDRLIRAALEAGGSDNITAIVLRYGRFVPLMAATVETEAEEEETDPEAAWRLSAAAEQDEQDEPEPAEETQSGVRPLLVTLYVLAALLTGICLGYFLFARFQPRPAAPIPQAPPVAPDYAGLEYDAKPTLVYKPVRDDVLLVEPGGSLLVGNDKGVLVRLLPSGKPATPAVGNNALAKAPAASTRKPLRPEARQDIALDPIGDRYQIVVRPPSIAKYLPSGLKIGGTIGENALRAPVRLGVAPNGDLYVIDDHRLLRFAAHSPVRLAK